MWRKELGMYFKFVYVIIICKAKLKLKIMNICDTRDYRNIKLIRMQVRTNGYSRFITVLKNNRPKSAIFLQSIQ